jgi:hypothetical protein
MRVDCHEKKKIEIFVRVNDYKREVRDFRGYEEDREGNRDGGRSVIETEDSLMPSLKFMKNIVERDKTFRSV